MNLLNILRERVDSIAAGDHTPGLRAVVQHVQVAINEACRALTSDTWVDDEAVWAGDQKCSPPYGIAHVKIAKPHSCAKGYLKEEGNAILTYDAFPEAREELRDSQQKILPRLMSALTCRFASEVTRDDLESDLRRATGLEEGRRLGGSPSTGCSGDSERGPRGSTGF